MNFLEYLSNDFIYSFFIGVVGLLLMVVESYTSKEKYTIKQYIKNFILISICVYIGLFIRTTSIFINFTKGTNDIYKTTSFSSNQTGGSTINLNNYDNVNIGDPNF